MPIFELKPVLVIIAFVFVVTGLCKRQVAPTEAERAKINHD